MVFIFEFLTLVTKSQFSIYTSIYIRNLPLTKWITHIVCIYTHMCTFITIGFLNKLNCMHWFPVYTHKFFWDNNSIFAFDPYVLASPRNIFLVKNTQSNERKYHLHVADKDLVTFNTSFIWLFLILIFFFSPFLATCYWLFIAR